MMVSVSRSQPEVEERKEDSCDDEVVLVLLALKIMTL
jgi:hypothetical protein